MRQNPPRKHLICSLTWIVAATCAVWTSPADDLPLKAQQREALADLQVLVGQWRGVGQPRRGSTRDSWIESSQWQWTFKGEQSALEFEAEKGRFYIRGRLSALDEAGQFQLEMTRTDNGQVDLFRGSLDDDGTLVLLAANDEIEPVARISLRTVASGDRLLILLERRTNSAGTFSRIAEIGYTRKGSGFGQGNSQRECIVTGGLGSMAVTYKGKTYYVCCGGCRELFEDDPEGVLEDYQKRLAEKKKEQPNTE